MLYHCNIKHIQWICTLTGADLLVLWITLLIHFQLIENLPFKIIEIPLPDQRVNSLLAIPGYVLINSVTSNFSSSLSQLPSLSL